MSDREKWRVVYWGFLGLATLFLFALYATRECEIGCEGFDGFMDRWGPWFFALVLPVLVVLPWILDWLREPPDDGTP